MKHPRRRTILKAVILIIAGAALNVAVAWGLVYIDNGGPSGGTILVTWTDEGLQHEVYKADGNGIQVISAVISQVDPNRAPVDIRRAGVTQDRSALPAWHLLAHESEHVREGPQVSFTDLSTGWPLRSMACRFGYAESWDDPDALLYGFEISSSTLPTGETYRRALPYRPLWPGFAINTVFYAGVLWVLCCGPFALRRMIRRRRGQCAQCAYLIGQNERCTECGAAVTAKAATI